MGTTQYAYIICISIRIQNTELYFRLKVTLGGVNHIFPWQWWSCFVHLCIDTYLLTVRLSTSTSTHGCLYDTSHMCVSGHESNLHLLSWKPDPQRNCKIRSMHRTILVSFPTCPSDTFYLFRLIREQNITYRSQHAAGGYQCLHILIILLPELSYKVLRVFLNL